MSLFTITYNEKFQTKYCKNRVLTILKVLVSLNFVRTPLRLISACQEMILSFRSRRTTFPRLNSFPARKPENVLRLENLLSQYVVSELIVNLESRASFLTYLPKIIDEEMPQSNNRVHP